MADLATLQTQLAEAEAARHKLLIGTQEVQVGQADMRVEYAKSEIGQLEAYIVSLRSQIVAAGGAVDGLQRRGISLDL